MALPGDSQNIAKISEMTENIAVEGYSKLKNIETTPFSKVFAALHTSTNNLVALKFIETTFVKDPVKIKQFIKESVAAGRLEHANIAKVFESGKIGNLDFFSMEFLYGRNLKDIMNDVHVFSPYLATEIILHVALALEHANDNALIHKGIKLENIVVLDATKNLKLQGFGLAHGVRSEIPEYKEILIDSLKYASPEQSAEKAIDFRSDIYSLGVCFYYLVTGKFPFESNDPEELINMHTTADVPKPTTIRFELNEDIELAILKMLAKKPEDRYDSYTALIDELAKILEIDDISSYLAPPAQAEEAIVVQPAFPMDAVMEAPQMLDNKEFVDIAEDEIEEISDDEIEEIEEIESAPQISLKMAPKKLKPGKKTEVARELKRKTTYSLKKTPKPHRHLENEQEKTEKHKPRRMRPGNETPEKPRRKRRPEETEGSGKPHAKRSTATKLHLKKQKETTNLRPAKKTANEVKPIPTKMTKPPVQVPQKTVQPAPKQIPAPPPAIVEPQAIPQPPSANEEPQMAFPEVIQETAKPVQMPEKTYPKSDSLESKTSSSKVSKAPKVPSDGGGKIRLNKGALQLDSSSKLSDIDSKKKAEEGEIEEVIADFSQIEVLPEDDENTGT